jgi:HEAT repeat protein
MLIPRKLEFAALVMAALKIVAVGGPFSFLGPVGVHGAGRNVALVPDKKKDVFEPAQPDEKSIQGTRTVVGQIEDAKPAELDELAKRLRSKDYDVQRKALTRIEELGEKAGSLAPIMVDLMTTDHQPFLISGMLAKMGPAAKQVEPSLRQRFKPDALPGDWRNVNVARALVGIAGPEPATVSVLLRQWCRGEFESYLHDIKLFGNYLTPLLLQLADSKEEDIRGAALRSLGEPNMLVTDLQKAKALQAARMWVNVEIDPAGRYRRQVGASYRLLIQLDEKTKTDVPLTVRMLAGHVLGADEALEFLKGRNEQAIPLLVERLGENVNVAATLARMAPASLPAVIGALEKADPHVRAGAAYSLQEMTARHKIDQAVPGLLKRLADPDPYARIRAAVTIMVAAPKNADRVVQAITPMLEKNEFPSVVVYALAFTGAAGKSALPALRDLVSRTNDRQLRHEALNVILAIDPAHGEQLVPVVLAVVQKKDSVGLDEQLYLISRLGASGRPFADELRKKLAKENRARTKAEILLCLLVCDPMRQDETYTSLRTLLGPESKPGEIMDVFAALSDIRNTQALKKRITTIVPLIPSFQALLKHADVDVRLNAIGHLADIGPAAKGAIADLQSVAQKDSNAEVRERATNALQRISQPKGDLPKDDDEVRRFQHTGHIYQIGFSPDGKMIFTDDQLWDVATGKKVATLPLPPLEHRKFRRFRLAFSPDSRHVAVHRYYDIVLIEATTGKEVWTVKLPERGNAYEAKPGLAFTPDGKQLLSARNDEALVRVLAVATGKEVRSFPFDTNDGGLMGVAIISFGGSADGKRVVVHCSKGGHLGGPVVLELETGKELFRYRVSSEEDWIHFSAPSPDGSHLAYPRRNAVHLLDLATGKEVRKFEGVERHAGLVAFSPNGKYIAAGVQAAGRDDNWVECWEVTTGKSFRLFKGDPSHITCLAFSPDGTHVLLGGADKTARLWRLKE